MSIGMASPEEIEREKQARRLRELFKGRFSDAESRQLLADKGGLSEAVDFVLNGDPQVVRQFINTRNSELLRALQRDSENVHQALSHGVETCIRQFACGPCDRYWWRKVPERKQVSKCKGCRVRYDPVPKEQEWGLAEFKCWCGNSFWGSGWLGTQSPCYRCQSLTSPIRILPPTQPRNQKKKTEHSCTAPNCYNRTIAYPQPVPHPDDGGGYGGGGSPGRGRRGGGGGRARGGGDGGGFPAAVDPGRQARRGRGGDGGGRGGGGVGGSWGQEPSGMKILEKWTAFMSLMVGLPARTATSAHMHVHNAVDTCCTPAYLTSAPAPRSLRFCLRTKSWKSMATSCPCRVSLKMTRHPSDTPRSEFGACCVDPTRNAIDRGRLLLLEKTRFSLNSTADKVFCKADKAYFSERFRISGFARIRLQRPPCSNCGLLCFRCL